MSKQENHNNTSGVWAAIEPTLGKSNPADTPQHHTSPDNNVEHSGQYSSIGLARSLIEKKYHPVMIFGTQASGKSSLLASLFHYLQNDPRSEAICMLGEWILPIDSTYGKTIADQIEGFFNRAVMNFNTGAAAPRTHHHTIPYFIPVVLRPSNGKPEIRLAFLESSGENYELNKDGAGYFKGLKDEILDVYRNFPGALSVLLVAPYTLKDAYTDQEIEPADDSAFQPIDQALYGALQSYQRERRWLDLDNYLFILTKWDVYTGGLSNPDFAKPPVGLVDKVISERYPLAWNFYRTMPKKGRSNSMQYSSGLITGSSVISVPDKLKPVIHQFPRALWNWLYMNASGGKTLNGPSNDQQKSTGLGSWLKKVLS